MTTSETLRAAHEAYEEAVRKHEAAQRAVREHDARVTEASDRVDTATAKYNSESAKRALGEPHEPIAPLRKEMQAATDDLSGMQAASDVLGDREQAAEKAVASAYAARREAAIAFCAEVDPLKRDEIRSYWHSAFRAQAEWWELARWAQELCGVDAIDHDGHRYWTHEGMPGDGVGLDSIAAQHFCDPRTFRPNAAACSFDRALKLAADVKK